ncbi:hypothetical protein [Bacillus sp. MUM 13]|uniref:hypothetical protein n=1 Tax=Bacillus sp. MUM 13 TaxID=1678001 RepID=UPI001113EA27|nr:hypothetical protein [Bacillus sp. MUM 13]
MTMMATCFRMKNSNMSTMPLAIKQELLIYKGNKWHVTTMMKQDYGRKKSSAKKNHEYYCDGNQLLLEVLWNGESLEQYRIYQWEEYTPIGMIIREKDESSQNWYTYADNNRVNYMIQM